MIDKTTVFPFLHFTQIFPNLPSSPISTPPSFHPQKRIGLQEMTANQDKTRYSKTMQKPSYPSRIKQPNRGKVIPRADKKVRDTPACTVRSPTKIAT